MDQAVLLQLLRSMGGGQGGGAAMAGNAIAARPAQLDAMAGGPPMGQQPQVPQGMPSMSQSQFTSGAPLTPEQQAQRQMALIQALRNRSGGAP